MLGLCVWMVSLFVWINELFVEEFLMLFDLILFVLYMFYVVLMCVFDVCLLIVIMCGIMFVEVVDYGCVFYEVGFWIVEVLLNLLELFDSIVELCCVLFDDMIVGVGIVLCVEYVDCV